MRGARSRTIQPARPTSPTHWIVAFLDRLRREDLSPVTVRGYRYDLRQFFEWWQLGNGRDTRVEQLSSLDLIRYRQYLVNVRTLKPTTINRRLEALRHFCRWAYETKRLKRHIAQDVKPLQVVRNIQPLGLVDAEVYSLLRVAGASTHGLGTRNYTLVQLFLQTGLRVGEVAALQVGDLVLRERAGMVRVRAGKGLKAREVPLNATARRALRTYLATREEPRPTDPLFMSTRGAAMPTRNIQATLTHLARRAKLRRLRVSAHTLRHTFALTYIRQNPGKLVELASLLGHESLDTTAIYIRPSREELAQDLERSRLNVDG
jgi:site-specific recombinase XerD